MRSIILLVIFLSSCTNNEFANTSKNLPLTNSETVEMVSMLNELNEKGNPNLYLHWNTKLAALYKKQIQQSTPKKALQYWFRYCNELLKSGQVEECIDEIEQFIVKRNTSYDKLINNKSFAIIELLALAYLRLGEVRNCQTNHNEHSCIIPLNEKAYHKETIGSKKAIELYLKLYESNPNDKYKWLLNLAYMTLGEHPYETPTNFLLNYPNWNIESDDFKPFKEVAMNLGIAENGLSGGVCFDDFNNDGLIDIFMTSYGMEDQCKYYVNTGKEFKDFTKEAGLNGIVSGLNCQHADYDNDGHKDILILRGAWLGKGGNHPNSLLKNMGNGTFIDVTKSAGILSFHPTQTASWADVNKDGYLDLFIGNESRGSLNHPCELYINQQDGTFLEHANEYNLGSIHQFVKGVSFGDINNDQWPDLYISVLGDENLLFVNNSGTFNEIGNSAGVQYPDFSFPCWFWDVNNDGYNDIFVNSYDTRKLKFLAADFAKELQGKHVDSDKSKLYINNGDETFTEQSEAYGLAISMYTMGSNFGDLDNDGWLDFYIGTGAPDFSTIIPNRMFKNNAGVNFKEVTSAGRFGHIQKGHGVGFADFDNDGDQDIYAVMGGAFEGDKFTNVCFENPLSENNWINIELEGVQSNKGAIGAQIICELDNSRKIYHYINSGSSFGGNSLEAEIGLGKSEKINSVKIIWPNSEEQVFKDLSINNKYKITEGQAKAKLIQYSKLKLKFEEAKHKHH